VISTVLLSANVAITTSFLALSREVIERLPIPTGPPLWIVGHLTAFAAILLMFFLIYKFVPGRRLKWPIAGIAALVAAVGFELLKAALGWYLANVADFNRVFFAFATVVVVVVSFYYGSVVFILGGEVGKVYGLRRAMLRQRESFGSS
jgi:membrane protein